MTIKKGSFTNSLLIYNWVILLNLIHTENLQFLGIFYNLAANEHGFLPNATKISINTPKQLRFLLILLDSLCFFLIVQIL